MVSPRERHVGLALDLDRPIRSDEMHERILDTTPNLSTVTVMTEKGPLLCFSFREKKFQSLGELLQYLKWLGFPDEQALRES